MSKDNIKDILSSIPDAATEDPSTSALASQSSLSEEEIQSLVKEAELERKYGDSDLRTFGESALSAATFGASDQAIAKFGGEEAQQALRERRQRNALAATAGTVAGVVVPTLASGGTSLAAKGVSAGVKTASTAGKVVEGVTAKQLAKILQETGKKKLAKDVILKSIPKTAGSAVEGAAYGVGQLISEEALGTADFNAENLVSHVGMGALIGGAAGGILGSVEALVPVIKNSKIVDVASKKINTNIDKSFAGAKLSGMTTSSIEKLKATPWGTSVYNNIPKFYKDNIKLKALDSTEAILKKTSTQLDDIGNQIGKAAEEVDDILRATNPQLLPTRQKVAANVQKSLEELRDSFKNNPDLNAKKSLKKINKRIKSWDEWLYSTDNVPITATELRLLKTDLQKVAKWNKSIDQIPLDGKLDRKVAEAIKNEFLSLADSVSTVDNALGAKLRQLNLDYATALTISENITSKVAKEASKDILGLKDILIADVATQLPGAGMLGAAALVGKKFIESDFRRKVTLLADVEKFNKLADSKIARGVKGFFTGPKKAAIPLSTKVLLESNLILPKEDGKKPKKPENKKEAFKQIKDSLISIQENPDKLVKHLETNALISTEAAPMTGGLVNSTVTAGISFLASKLPRNASSSIGMFPREYEPSSIELAKFERYVAAVENPMSVIEDLESGTITREGVEALRTVYPNMYARIQSQVMEQIQQHPNMAYAKKIQLGILLDVPSDVSLNPENITALQQMFADLQQQKEAAVKPAVNTTVGALGDITMAQDSQTESERISNRK